MNQNKVLMENDHLVQCFWNAEDFLESLKSCGIPLYKNDNCRRALNKDGGKGNSFHTVSWNSPKSLNQLLNLLPNTANTFWGPTVPKELCFPGSSYMNAWVNHGTSPWTAWAFWLYWKSKDIFSLILLGAEHKPGLHLPSVSLLEFLDCSVREYSSQQP